MQGLGGCAWFPDGNYSGRAGCGTAERVDITREDERSAAEDEVWMEAWVALHATWYLTPKTPPLISGEPGDPESFVRHPRYQKGR